MFFFYGWGTKAKALPYTQKRVCHACNSTGYSNVVMRYSYFSLFFIPIIKWNKTYFLQCPVCGAVTPIDKQTFLDIKNGVYNQAPAPAGVRIDPFAEEPAQPELATTSEEAPTKVEGVTEDVFSEASENTTTE